MRLGIDASNIRGGGGLTHLLELLRAAKPGDHGFESVIIWGGAKTLNLLDDRPWLKKIVDPALDKGFLSRLIWQRFRLTRAVRSAQCDILFVPGGTFFGTFHPFVTMSRNMLPFEWREMKRFGFSRTFFRYLLLQRAQTKSFRNADGLIFLTQYAHDAVMKFVSNSAGETSIIHHGVDKRFLLPVRKHHDIKNYSPQNPFRLLYVSIVNFYKHQWHVVEAVSQLRAKGYPVELRLIGPAYPAALKRLQEKMKKVDPAHEFVNYVGPVPYEELECSYKEADLSIFASSCENMPNILLEAMAASLPIACSNRGPMPEVLGEAGVYFDPENPEDICSKLIDLIRTPALREKLALEAQERSAKYSWARCAESTFKFLSQIATMVKNETNPSKS